MLCFAGNGQDGASMEGEECDPDDGVPHLSAALACIAIIIDAGCAGKLNDDRMINGGYRKIMDELTPHVARLKKLHEKKNPRHYTMADNAEFPVKGKDEKVDA